MPLKVLRASVLAVLAVGTSAALAQPTPVLPGFRFGGGPLTDNFQPTVGRSGDGFVVAWTSRAAPPSFFSSVLAQRFDSSGAALGSVVRLSTTQVDEGVKPTVAVDPTGDFMAVWRERSDESRLLARFCDASGMPRSGEIEIDRDNNRFTEFNSSYAAALGDGRFVTVWEDHAGGLLSRRYDRFGTPLGPDLRISAPGWPDQSMPVATAYRDGFVVAWLLVRGQESAFAGQRFSDEGSPLGEIFEIAPPAVGGFSAALAVALATAPDGGFLAVWNNGLANVAGRRFGPDGQPLGPSFSIAADFLRYPALAVSFEPGGRALVAWSNVDNVDFATEGQILDAGGRLEGPRFPIAVAAVTGLREREFVVLWPQHSGPSGSLTRKIFERRLRIPPPGDEPCLLAEGRLTCDTLRTGEGTPLPVAPLLAGDVPLAGDLDGNRQDDFCFYRTGLFVCDTGHDLGAAVQIRFGGGRGPGDTPLLGDVNGDGRDDPCLRRGRRFVCDTAHNGGVGEVQIVFGLQGDLPLLGDLDGDGDDDPCLFRGGHFLCDTAHNGGNAEADIPFGRSGDLPLLGDVDGDGRDDPCVFRGGRFLCDTAHNGGAAEVERVFGSPGAVPLLGNLDGF
jgi:hypothetical protein